MKTSLSEILQRLEERLGLKQSSPETVKGYKFVSQDLESYYGDQTWEPGKWYVHDGEVKLRKSGFHARPDLYSAYSGYLQGKRLFEVEAVGAVYSRSLSSFFLRSPSNGLFAAREMRLVREIDLKRLSIDYAVNCARHVLPNYEKAFPKDDRPRKAIEAAEDYLRYPSNENMYAAAFAGDVAWSASLSAKSAYLSAKDAARGALSAARSAWSAAQSAPDSAWSTGDVFKSAKDAAFFASLSARDAAKEKKWQKELLENLVQRYYI